MFYDYACTKCKHKKKDKSFKSYKDFQAFKCPKCGSPVKQILGNNLAFKINGYSYENEAKGLSYRRDIPKEKKFKYKRVKEKVCQKVIH